MHHALCVFEKILALPEVACSQDAVAFSSNVTFKDQDLDQWQVAGNISWQPQDTSAPRSKAGSAWQTCRSKDILEYMVYMADDPFGANRSLLGTASANSSSFFVEANTPLLSFTHFLIYSRLLSSLKPSQRPGPLWWSKALQAQWPSWMRLCQHINH